MTRGRATQSEAEREAKGNPGRKPPRAKVADLGPAKGTAPKELSAAAVQIWNLLAPDLRLLNFLRDTDLMAFARYCEHAAKWWQLTKKLAAMGGDTYTTDSLHGKMERLRPDFLVRERIERRLESLEDRFGMNPAYRQQILQRMAGLMPATPGELFETNPQSDDSQPSTPATRMPSAIGVLRKASNTVN